MDDKIREHWCSRAEMGKTAGTNDFMLKDLELTLIGERVDKGCRVLDVGCGNGVSLIHLAQNNDCTGVGLDFAEKMVESAQTSAVEQGLADRISFRTGQVPGLPEDLSDFDWAVSERCLQNLDGDASQRQAFAEIIRVLRPGGRYLMIESSTQGLERINELRTGLDLERIEAPWHNQFLNENSVEDWGGDLARLEEMIPFSSTYYFLSRVVYARLARDSGEELVYDSPINKIGCALPPIGNLGPTRAWLWRRL